MRSRAELEAYSAFLLSEKLRHQEDINVIDGKLKILASKGIVPERAGDWIKEEELSAWGEPKSCQNCGHPMCSAVGAGNMHCELWQPIP